TSEDPQVLVGVIEAGEYVQDMPQINIPGMAGSGVMNKRIDWCFTSVPQATANGRVIDQPRGKVLGGSSALNLLVAGRASAEEYDALEALGNPGWNWNGLLKYFKKSETLHYPPADLATKYEIGWHPHFHGSDGPLQLTYPRYVWDLHKPWAQTLDRLGIPNNPEPSGGNNAGSTFIAGCVDPVSATRSYSTTAYYEPNQQRKNLVVLPQAQATRVLFDSTASPVVATGVEYFANGSKYTAHASQEVVLSAGSLQTPQLLELSGIGDATLLKKFGIHTVVDLPAVGENLPSTFETTDEWATSDLFRDPALRAKEMDLYVTKKEGRFSSAHSAYAFLPLRTFCDPKTVQSMKAEIANDPFYTTTSGLRKQIEYLTTWFDNPAHPQIEMIQNPQMRPGAGVAEPGKKYQTLMACNMHPLSRGSVHIQSRDPLSQPAIDPGYLRNPLDLAVLVLAVRFARQLTAAAPLSSTIVRECAPGADAQTDEQIAEFVKNTLSPVYHPVGSASMLPREDGGVVDPRLVVYGTKNLRIVDASILPLVECFTCFESSEG
ncbi:hypothetical protein EW146_g9725, partial [Bondarzewia mesenterica]